MMSNLETTLQLYKNNTPATLNNKIGTRNTPTSLNIIRKQRKKQRSTPSQLKQPQHTPYPLSHSNTISRDSPCVKHLHTFPQIPPTVPAESSSYRVVQLLLCGERTLPSRQEQGRILHHSQLTLYALPQASQEFVVLECSQGAGVECPEASRLGTTCRHSSR